MSFHAANLRLVGFEDDHERETWRADQLAALEVVKENRRAAYAAPLDPRDPRWVLAMQTRARLQGATLPPESRSQLIHNGKKLGLRPFEANLVIAIVQDEARTSGISQHHLAVDVDDRGAACRAFSPQPDRRTSRNSFIKWTAALLAAAGVALLAARWLIGP